MLPAAPTSPLWWVARWWSRLLTGLAVAIAFAVAGPALSGPALSGPALSGPALSGPALSGPALPGPASLRPASFDPGPAAAALPVDASLSLPAAGAPAAPTDIRSGGREADPAAAADRAVAVVLAVPAADRAAVVLAVPTADRVDAVVPAGVARSAPPPALPAGRTPVATAPRAPPEG
ncbi:hypothetical protein [Micromonospora antibiotica]|uniref:Meckel syndrome type 1 protein n=1 Tax=Micromonospora antibiotica TaxID=2807623 RepID=A0ABS3VCY1_9ACTN|nr:hypothetical protein [Micromonospora antibiotica]MBO4163483.1 hypothetical protein [Micromonospora antibiotica]